MNWFSSMFSTVVGKKFLMALTGLFLISFLLIHAYVNLNVLFTNGEENFNRAAHFMGTNLIIRILEIGLFAGFIAHIYQGYVLEYYNRTRRSIKYAVSPGNATSKWYSRSMGLLGTLILLFLIVHIIHFWVPSRFGGLQEFTASDGLQMHNLYLRMDEIFMQEWVVALYVAACISLGWHLVHGFKSAFQTMGWYNPKFGPTIQTIGIGLSVLIPFVFALMPIFMYFNWEIDMKGLTLFF